VGALAVVLVVVGVVVGAILRQSGLTSFGRSAAPPALVGKAYTLQGAGSLSCFSAPVWSPDGKRLAVVAAVQAATDSCFLANTMMNISQPDSVGVSQTNGLPPDTFAIAIVDAATGHVTRTVKLPKLSNSALCARDPQCQYASPAWESVGWSPDGRSVAAFFTYTFLYQPTRGSAYTQERGVLIVAPVDGSSAPRLLIGKGRIQPEQNTGHIDLNAIYSAPRFTWNLATGVATPSDIHRSASPFTTPFATGYQLGADGALAVDQQPQAGDVSPWRVGVLLLTNTNAATPLYSYQTSQWLWSADGRFALPNLDTGAYVSIPGVTAQPPANTSGLAGEATVSPPDAAIFASVRAVAALRHSAALARNPDGKLLATYGCGASAGELTIRNVASGATLAHTSYSYPLTSFSLGCVGDIEPIAWSPDGARIATTDGVDGQIIIWRVNLHA